MHNRQNLQKIQQPYDMHDIINIRVITLPAIKYLAGNSD